MRKFKKKNNRENIAFTPRTVLESPKTVDESLLAQDDYEFINN